MPIGVYKRAIKENGTAFSDKGLENMSIAHRGKKQSLELIEKRISPLRGRKRAPFSEEWIRKMSESHKKEVTKSAEYKRKYAREYLRKKRVASGKVRINHAIHAGVYIALKEKKAGRKWEIIVGYTLDDLVWHLEAQFDNNMSWDNYGGYWSVDHIKPISSFSIEKVKDCWALVNLRPMEKIANIRKGASLIY